MDDANWHFLIIKSYAKVNCNEIIIIITIIIIIITIIIIISRMNALNYRQTDGFLENCFRLWTMLKVCRWRFLSFFGTAHVTQKL